MFLGLLIFNLYYLSNQNGHIMGQGKVLKLKMCYGYFDNFLEFCDFCGIVFGFGLVFCSWYFKPSLELHMDIIGGAGKKAFFFKIFIFKLIPFSRTPYNYSHTQTSHSSSCSLPVTCLAMSGQGYISQTILTNIQTRLDRGLTFQKCM